MEDLTKKEMKALIKVNKLEKKKEKKLAKLNRKNTIKKKLGYTERLVKNVLIACWIVVFSAVIYSFRYMATEVWSYTLDVVKYLSVSTIGFFIWKARSENLIKIGNNPDFEVQQYVQEMQERVMQDFKDETMNLDKEKYI